MTLDMSPIVHQATTNRRAKRSWCLLHPDNVLQLAGAYLSAVKERDDLRRRLAEIAALVPPALVDGVCNYRPELHEKLEEIGEIAKLPIDKPGEL